MKDSAWIRWRLSVVLGALALSCSSTSGLKPAVAPDPEIACPGGRLAWNLEFADQRARRPDSERLRMLLRESLSRSFPGCQWTAADPSAPTIRIEVHHFDVSFDAATWEAVAEWTVLVHDASGRTLTEFVSEAQVSRPNYRGLNNEREALQQAFEQAMNRTLSGLRSVSSAG